LKGFYDIELKFAVDGLESPAPAESGTPPPGDPAGPSIFTAIQEQLGFKLDSTKGPVEVLVIDSVQRPAEN
jgi:uncharacterized protein (TIGR03435 family)